MKHILLTGAGGGVATMIRPLLRPHYRLRLSDRVPLTNLTAEETQVPSELADLAGLRKAVAGVDGIIHLGGYSREANWETIHEANIVGAYNLFEAARLEGVKRVVFASSNHAIGFYPRSQTIGDEVTVRPDSRYGLSKAFGEGLGSLYAYKYGVDALSIRIGHVAEKPMDVRRLSIFISPRDLVQLIRIGLDHPDIRHEVVYGMSDNKRGFWDNSNAFRLGYKPQDRSEDYAAEVLAAGGGQSGDPRIELNQGGEFCVAEDF